MTIKGKKSIQLQLITLNIFLSLHKKERKNYLHLFSINLLFYKIQSLFKQATSIPSLLNSENISPLRSGSEKQDTPLYTPFSTPLISYTQNAL